MANDAVLGPVPAAPLLNAVRSGARNPWLVGAVAALAVVAAWQATGTTPRAVAYLWQWLPALLRGLWVNIEISVLAVALGTAVGLVVGALSLSPVHAVRVAARCHVQVFRNAPILVLIYFTTYVFPFEVHLVQWTFPFPDWVKVVLGLALPTSANVAEIFRGAIQSIPAAQWEAAQSRLPAQPDLPAGGAAAVRAPHAAAVDEPVRQHHHEHLAGLAGGRARRGGHGPDRQQHGGAHGLHHPGLFHAAGAVFRLLLPHRPRHARPGKTP